MQRKPPIRSQKIRNAARGESCTHCGRQDGTVVAAHYQGIGSARLGKGGSQKPGDLFVAFLCDSCHGYFDSYEAGNDPDRAIDFALAVFVTQDRLWRAGIIGDRRKAA